MVKKILKYAKFVVCCALIVSLIAPSYAALSASDGSAFVTKTEFDAAMADFNSRLTTFEAGINSKIDSQVTSYLDRNGIWNGKEQTLLFSGEVSVFIDGSGGSAIGYWGGFAREAYTGQLNFSYSTSDQPGYVMNPKKVGDGEILYKTTKSGLMRIDFTINELCDNKEICNAFVLCNRSQTFYTHGIWNGHIMLTIDGSIVCHMAGKDKEWHPMGDGGLNPYNVSYNSSSFFFVSKDDVIKTNLLSEKKEDSGKLPYLWDNRQIACKLAVSFNKAYVY